MVRFAQHVIVQLRKEENLAFALLIPLTLVLLASPLFFYLNTESEVAKTTPDPVTPSTFFTKTFADTGKPWPPEETTYADGLSKNPLCGLRAQYCDALDYTFDSFSCDCVTLTPDRDPSTYHSTANTSKTHEIFFPNTWVETDFDPMYTTNTVAQRARTNTACRIEVGLLNDTNSEPDVISHTYANSVYTPLEYIHNGLVRSNEQYAAGLTDTQAIIAPHFPLPDSTHAVVLYSSENIPLIKGCIDEFIQMLTLGVHIILPTEERVPDSTGTISIVSQYNAYHAGYNATHLVFEDDETYAATKLSPDTFTYTPSGNPANPFYRNSTIYYAADNSLYAFDIATGKAMLHAPTKASTIILGTWVTEDAIYYLSSPNCTFDTLQASENCTVSPALFAFSFETGTSELITLGVGDTDILGTTDQGTLITTSLHDELSCDSVYDYKEISTADGTTVSTGTMQYCYDADGNAVTDLASLQPGRYIDHVVYEQDTIETPDTYRYTDQYAGRIRMLTVAQ